MSAYTRAEPGLVLLCLLELKVCADPVLDLACPVSAVPRRLRPHARPAGPGSCRLPREAALRWVESVAEAVRG